MGNFQQRVFGKYTLLERIAVGGMAEIFKAKTQGYGGFEKVLAIKRLHPQFSDDHNFVRMLVDEAKIAVLLQHSNIVQILDLGRIGRHYYIAMEYVEGRDLFQVLRMLHQNNWKMPIETASFVVANICEGLHYAHTKHHPATQRPLNVVHRDVSPQNVLLSWAGEVKLADFGIVKADQRSTVTEAGVIKGKFYYMSPEQARGAVLDARSDIFSAGIVLFEALTSQPLYDDAESETLLEQVQRGPTRKPREIREDIPEELEAICLKALSVDPAKRFQSSLEFSRDLFNFLTTLGSAYTKPDLGEYLIELYREPSEEELLERAPTEAAIVLDTIDDGEAVANQTLEVGDRIIAQAPSEIQFNKRDADSGANLPQEDVIASSDLPKLSVEVHDTITDESPTPNLAKTEAISEDGIKQAEAERVAAQPEPKPQGAKRRIAEVQMLTPLPNPGARVGITSYRQRIEMRLKMALGVVLAAILCVSAAIFYLLFADIDLPPAEAASPPSATAPQKILPSPVTGPEKTIVPSPTAAGSRPNEITSSGSTAQIQIVTKQPNQRYRLYINGELAAVKDGKVAVEAGRHTIRAQLRPEGSWTKDQVIEVVSGDKIKVNL